MSPPRMRTILVFSSCLALLAPRSNFWRAVLVNPYDAESVAGAIAQALTMTLEERRERHQELLHGILENNVD